MQGTGQQYGTTSPEFTQTAYTGSAPASGSRFDTRAALSYGGKTAATNLSGKKDKGPRLISSAPSAPMAMLPKFEWTDMSGVGLRPQVSRGDTVSSMMQMILSGQS